MAQGPSKSLNAVLTNKNGVLVSILQSVWIKTPSAFHEELGWVNKSWFNKKSA